MSGKRLTLDYALLHLSAICQQHNAALYGSNHKDSILNNLCIAHFLYIKSKNSFCDLKRKGTIIIMNFFLNW